MGDEGNIAKGLLAGGSGIVPVCANYEPETFVGMFETSESGNADLVWQLQGRVDYLRDRLPRLAPCWISGIKYGLATLGMGSGKPVSPLQPLTEEEKQVVDEMTRTKRS